jgi:hypothetical protein
MKPESGKVTHNRPVRRTDSALFDQNGKVRGKSGVSTWTIA